MNPFQSDNIWKKKARQGKAQQHPLTPQQEWQKQVNSSSLWLGGGVVLLALYLAAVRAGTVALVQLFAGPIVALFDPNPAVVAAGVTYLRIEGACYIGIGILFLLYGYYRAVNQPGMSVVLTIASLGTRVALAYLLSATPLGVTGIWLSVPIGWALADVIGIGYYLVRHKKVTQ